MVKLSVTRTIALWLFSKNATTRCGKLRSSVPIAGSRTFGVSPLHTASLPECKKALIREPLQRVGEGSTPMLNSDCSQRQLSHLPRAASVPCCVGHPVYGRVTAPCVDHAGAPSEVNSSASKPTGTVDAYSKPDMARCELRR